MMQKKYTNQNNTYIYTLHTSKAKQKGHLTIIEQLLKARIATPLSILGQKNFKTFKRVNNSKHTKNYTQNCNTFSVIHKVPFSDCVIQSC